MNREISTAIVQKRALQYQSGFTLFELMISIAIIAILSSIGLPAYQSYVQKAAMTDVLQAMVPYKTAVELCALEQGSTDGCNQGRHGIPETKTTRYVSEIQVTKGAITLKGQQTLQGLLVTVRPTITPATGEINWNRECTHSAGNRSQLTSCEEVFRFGAGNAP